MKTVVFDHPPSLNANEEQVADLHSFLNVLNILSGELYVSEMTLSDCKEGGAEKLEPLVAEVRDIAESIRNSIGIKNALKRVEAAKEPILGTLSDLLETLQGSEAHAEVSESVENIRSILTIADERIAEMEARSTDPDIWIKIGVDEVDRRFREVFAAIEKNAKGRYRILFNLAQKQKSSDYYIDFKIDGGIEPGVLWMPLRLMDVARDLTANARKYTKAGGKVAMAFYQDKDSIQVVVEDEGCGIPEDEIESVVEFGYRASNVRDRPTMGGGFGLTKAAWLVHRWGGQFSIASAEGKGTVVRILLPNKELSE